MARILALIRKQISLFLELVKFEHTIFALPFAYLGMVLAAEGWPTLEEFVWITVAMAAARTVAFAVNRAADRFYDSRNPRTANRPIPRGAMSASTAWGVAAAAGSVLAFSAWELNDLCFKLFPLALVFLIGYSYTKRFTWLSHWVLGFTDGMAPVGAWIAVRPTLTNPVPWLLLAAVTFWIAGFDLIYACQDTEFDREMGLHSLPARFGNGAALLWAKMCHLLTIIFLGAAGWIAGLGVLYWIGLVAAAAMLAYENSIVKPDDLSRVNLAFFTMNGYVSITVFVAAILGMLW